MPHTPSSTTAPRPQALYVLPTLLAGAVFFVAHLPTLGATVDFLLADAGASLKLEALLDAGLRPAIDFGYNYGPLSAVASQLGYSLLGRTVTAHLILVALLCVGALTGLARCMARLENGWTGLVMSVVFAQAIVRNLGLNLTYGLEAACLLHALAFHLEGRRDRALMLAVLAALVKPSMGILYAGILVGWILLRSSGLRETWARLWPAAVTAVVALGCSMVVLGFQSTLRTALPLSGMTHYEALEPPLTKLVNTLAAPPGVNFKYYLGSLSGFWILGSVVLVLGSLRAIPAAILQNVQAEVGLSCAALHVAFATLFFGPWPTYLGLLAVGLFCVVTARPLRWVLVAIVVLGSKQMTSGAVASWKERRPDASLLGSWVLPSERQEVAEVLRIAGSRPIYFVTTGYPEGAIPNSRGTRSWFVAPGMISESEQAVIVQEVRAAPVVAVGKVLGIGALQFDWLREALSGHKLQHDGKHFTVYVKDGP
ncbi:hypothetical protein [Hyalangium minutum]|uniref:Glycosyltransferase RgtA/B/C/D-like domain-containing protein n=1 Tax=Hyalangium minutum TaxID=394096 RepID=A0A085WL09_9BACT|nr:hypothetical protein [Hyalangium minutum]KFE68372.1 hypothetical protein DB31_7609 [Hyalangium minutum]